MAPPNISDPTQYSGPPTQANPPAQQSPTGSGGFMGILKNRILPAIGPIAARLGAVYGNPMGLEEEYRQKQLQMQQGLYGPELARAQAEATLAGKQAAVAPGSEEEELARFRQQMGIQHELTPAQGIVGGNLEMGSFAPNPSGPGLNFLPAGITGGGAPPPGFTENPNGPGVPGSPGEANPPAGMTGHVGAPFKPEKLGIVPDGKGGYVQQWGNALTRDITMTVPVPTKTRQDKISPDPTGKYGNTGWYYPDISQIDGTEVGGKAAPPPAGLVSTTTTSNVPPEVKEDESGNFLSIPMPDRVSTRAPSFMLGQGAPPGTNAPQQGAGATTTPAPVSPGNAGQGAVPPVLGKAAVPSAAQTGTPSIIPGVKGKNASAWATWQDASGNTVAGPKSQASSSGGKNMTDLSPAEAKDVQNARQLLTLLDKKGDTSKPETMGTLQLIDSLDKDGKLGVFASRWNELMTRGIGAAPGDDPRIVTLLNKTDLADTLAMMAHFGASGGRSPQMLQHFMDLGNAGKMDGPTLKAGLLAVEDYMKNRAMMPSASAAGTPPSVLNRAARGPQNASDYLKSIGVPQ